MIEAQRPDARKTARAALLIGLAISAAFFLWVSAVRAPQIAVLVSDHVQAGQPGYFFLPRGVLGAGLSLVVGVMAGTLLAILVLNRHRLKRVFRPTAGKIIAILVLGLTVPIGLFTFIPINGLVLLGMLPDMGVVGPHRAVGLMLTIVKILVPLFLCGLIVPPLIYGIRSRFLRFALLIGVWVAAFALQVLLNGLYVGPLTL